jgi:methionine sulfoxide reductase heme-binding subunit
VTPAQPDPMQHGWWLASRASGLVALVLITASVGLGLMMAGRVMRRPGLARKFVAIHEHTALAGLIAIAVHGITLMGDSFLRPGIAGITVPFAIGYRPFFTAFGIVGGYLAAALGLSFYARKRIGPRLWRKAHRLTFGVWILALVHTIGAGTDASTPWLRTFMLATAVPIVALFGYRALGASKPAPASRPAPQPVPVREPA